MSNFKEIVTKAVIAKGKKNFVTNHSISLDTEPSTILGCWIINHRFKGQKNKESIDIEGSYDVNIWYSCLDDTKTEVIKQTNTYKESVILPINNNGGLSSDNEVIIRSLKQPNCIKAEIDNGSINYTVEKELGIELVGDTKVKIAVDDIEEPWQDLKDPAPSVKAEKEIDKEIKEDFLK